MIQQSLQPPNYGGENFPPYFGALIIHFFNSKGIRQLPNVHYIWCYVSRAQAFSWLLVADRVRNEQMLEG